MKARIMTWEEIKKEHAQEWIPDMTLTWDRYEFVQNADRDREDCGGEWPPGETR